MTSTERRKKFSKSGLLYVILDEETARSHSLDIFALADAVSRWGADIIQYRFTGSTDREAARTAIRLSRIIHKHNKLFIVNNRADIARLSCADGMHAGENDLSTGQIRAIIGKGGLIGRTLHSAKEAQRHTQDPLDYCSAGAVYASGTKKNVGQLSVRELARIISLVTKPLFAVGGIRLGSVPELLSCGIRNIAVSGDIILSADLKTRLQKYKQCLKKVS